jgi:beta-lactamase class A
LTTPESDYCPEIPSQLLKRRSGRNRPSPSRKKSPFSSQLQFVAITTAIILIFIIIGLLLTQRKTEPPVQNSPQPPASLPEKSDLSSVTPPTNLPPSSLPQPTQQNQELVYQFHPYPDFRQSQKLKAVVDGIVKLARNNKLPTENLSITLIDVNSGEIAGYQQEKLRYPASVVKLFWLVALYGQFSAGFWQNPKIFTEDLYKMIKQSDNEASSRIVDAITNTRSGTELSGKQYKEWLEKRYSLNQFFQKAGYQNINISQKTFPIPSENLYEPKGNDLKMRGNKDKPTRNKISTQQAAQLMYEIVTGRAISPEISQNLQQWLAWDLTSQEWKNIDPNTGRFNPIQTFFGESLPTDIYFASKAGWTANTRQEVAFVRTRDGKTAYILAAFAEDAAYAKNGQIFPQISRQVFDRLNR